MSSEEEADQVLRQVVRALARRPERVQVLRGVVGGGPRQHTYRTRTSLERLAMGRTHCPAKHSKATSRNMR